MKRPCRFLTLLPINRTNSEMQKTLAWSTVIPLCSEGRGKKKKIIKEREDERGFPSLKQQLLETGAGAGGREGLLITVCEPPTEKKKKIGVKAASGI